MQPEHIRQDLVDRVNDLPVPEDFKNFQFKAIPLQQTVFIQEIKAGNGGIGAGRMVGQLFIPETEATQGTVGRIVAVGPLCYPYLKVGLKVMYNYHANLRIAVDGQEYLSMHQMDVFAILTEETKCTMDPMAPNEKRIIEKRDREEKMRIALNIKKNNDRDKEAEGLKKFKRTSKK